MIQYLYGRPGRGKLTYIIDKIKQTKKLRGSILIIPVRETVNIDKRIARSEISGYVDVYTLPLLCKEIFNLKGGNGKSSISKSAKKILMYKILTKKDEKLNLFGSISKNDEKAVDNMLSLYKECAENNIDVNKLVLAKEKLGEKDVILSKKIDDICRIFTEYDNLVNAKWNNSEWDIIRAAKMDNELCKGKDIYIYGFNTIKESEMMLLENVMSKASNVYISFKYDYEYDSDIFDFTSQIRLKKRFDNAIFDMNNKYGVKQSFTKPLFFRDNHKYDNEELEFFTRNIYHPIKQDEECDIENEHIRVYSCTDTREECESVCCDISKQIFEKNVNIKDDEEELRFANCAIVASNIKDYERELENAFEKYSIPYYMVEEEDIRNESIIQYLFKCLDCLTYDFQINDVLSLVKNGFFDSDNETKDLFEKYLLKWEIKGFKAYEKQWTNSPLGFNSRNDDYIKQVLSKVNDIRKKIYDSFSSFIKDKKAHNVREHSTMLYDFLMDQNIVERINNISSEIAKENIEEAQKLLDIWKSVYDCFDEIIDTLEDSDVFDLDEYIQIMRMCLSEVHTRSSKTTLDRVIVGSIDKVRYGDVKNLYIMGVNDGVFPGERRETSCLTDKEKERLNATELVNISGTRDKRMFDEMIDFFSIICIPRTDLVMTYHTFSNSFESTDKSIGIIYAEDMFKNLKEIVFENVNVDRIWRSDQAFENMIYFNDDNKTVVYDIYKEKCGDYDDRIESFDMNSLSINEYKIDEDLAKELFSKNRMSTSYSSIQKYITCQYAYFCDKFLRTYDDNKASFDASHEGNLMHLILEQSVETVKDLVENKLDNPDFETIFDKEINSLIDKNTEEYLKSQMFDSKEMSSEFKNQIGFLKMAAYRALTNTKDMLKDSLFKPMYYEIRISEKPSLEEQAYIEPFIIKKDGSDSELVINGIIDRVDMYKSPDGKTYVKIVDYKSSSKSISLEMVKKGINTQMLLYLFSIEENGIKSTKGGKILLDKNDVVPAGTVYIHVDSGIEDENSKENIKNALVLDSFKTNLGKEVYMGKEMSDNIFTYKSESSTGNDFNKIKKDISNTLIDLIDDKMKVGCANTFPNLYTDEEIKKLDQSPCTYCKYKAVCRNAKITKYY